MAVANIVGSNIFNVLLILGVTALIRPLRVDPGLLEQDMPVMLLFAVVLVPFARFGQRLSRTHGALLLGAYAIYLLLLVAAP